jgi:hypothetical protein
VICYPLKPFERATCGDELTTGEIVPLQEFGAMDEDNPKNRCRLPAKFVSLAFQRVVVEAQPRPREVQAVSMDQQCYRGTINRFHCVLRKFPYEVLAVGTKALELIHWEILPAGSPLRLSAHASSKQNYRPPRQAESGGLH